MILVMIKSGSFFSGSFFEKHLLAIIGFTFGILAVAGAVVSYRDVCDHGSVGCDYVARPLQKVAEAPAYPMLLIAINLIKGPIARIDNVLIQIFPIMFAPFFYACCFGTASTIGDRKSKVKFTILVSWLTVGIFLA